MSNIITLDWNGKNVNVIKYAEDEFYLNVVDGVREVAGYYPITRDDVIVDLEQRGLIKPLRGTRLYEKLAALLGWEFTTS
jgi:hypothetical protein